MSLVQANVALQDWNTLATPAVAEFFAELSHAEQLPELLDFARQRELPVGVLGEGSNVVLGDHLPGLWLRQSQRGCEVLDEGRDSVDLRLAAGENWHHCVQWCLARGYFGLENLALIPGTVGAAPIQNIGAYGVEIGPRVLRVTCRQLDTGERLTLDNSQCRFGYRTSSFKGPWRDRVLIDSVELRLPLNPQVECSYPALSAELARLGVTAPTPADVFEAVVAVRSRKLPDPAVTPNVGSFFKNPVVAVEQHRALCARFGAVPDYPQGDGTTKLPAAWLIEQCGFREQQEGAVRVHPQHALVIINPERRPAAEILQFAGRIRDAVADRFAITLEQEPRIYPHG